MAIIPFKRKSTPTRQVSGTSYSTKKQAALSAADYTEKGSGKGSRIFDPLQALGNRQQARRTYTMMSRADASVRVSLRAGKAPVLGAEFFVDPFSDDEQDLIIREMVEFNLFEGMTTPWLKFLEQALKMFENGFSCFEPVWELREWSPRKTSTGANRKKYTMLRKLAVRPSETIADFIYDDNGGPVSVRQQAIRKDGRSELVEIPIEKLCIFTFDQDGGDLQGNSILRSAYQHWYYKDHLYKIDGVQKERHSIGVPDIELQPGYTEADKEFAHELGRNLRTNEFAYIVRTPFLKVGFADIGQAQLVDPLKSAEHHDLMIMKNIMVQFLNAGISGGGSRASSATSMDMFLKAMRYIANIFCEGINLYVIPNMVSYNFKTDRFPKLQVRNIGEAKDLQMWAAAMGNLKKNDLIQIDDETEQWMRKQTDMPRRTSAYQEKGQSEVITETRKDGGSGPTSGNVGESPSSAKPA